MRDEANLPTVPADASSGDGVVALGGHAVASRYGRFVTRGVIGQGGMGVVLRAHDPELDRDVAIKVLSPGLVGSNDSTRGQRLQREAQAMAKLSHPNVVQVYDTGQVDGSRYIVMELVEGTTLRRWMVGGTRTWEEIVDAFVACGRGLAAAHAADLVHRDFKPENVLIGGDGRPQVTDFGLVATGVRVASISLGDSGVNSNLTVDGAVLGTPAYMAPEQWQSGEVDARTDQFAFCIALWEGVYGERPFAGRTGNELRENVTAGRLREPPRDKRVPRRVERVLRRGLAVERADRWPSMLALVAALERPRHRRWPVIVAAGSAVVAAGALAFVALAGDDARNPCPDPAPRLAGVWDAAAATRVKAAFAAASPGAGAAIADRVVAKLDAYAADWRAAMISACRATEVERTQSPQLLDERMVCLDRRLGEVRVLGAALANADRELVNRAVDAAGALTALDVCADKEALLAHPQPNDAGMRRRVADVDAMIVEAEKMQYAGDLAGRQARAAAAVEQARAVGYPPLLLRALDELHLAASTNSDLVVAKAALRELAQESAKAQDDSRAAKAWISLILMLAESHEIAEAKALDPVAEAAVARAGSKSGHRLGLLVARGTRHLYAGELDAAVAAYEEAIGLAEVGTLRAPARQALAQALYLRDGPVGALPILEEGLKETEAIYGPTHPRVADGLNLMSQMRLEAGDLEKAFDAETRSLAIREATLAPGHREIAMSLHQLANVELRRGNTKRARELYLRAISIFDGAGRPADSALAQTMLGGLVADEDGLAAARPYFEAGLAGLAKSFGEDSVQYAHMESNYAQRLVDADQCAEADPHIAHVIDVLDRKQQRDLPLVMIAMFVCDEQAKRFDAAIAKLERGRAACAATRCEFPDELAFEHGRLLYETGRDRARGRALVAEAAQLAATNGTSESRATIEAWRKTHR